MEYYNEIAAGYHELYRDEQLNKLKIIKENIKVMHNTKLLDVGCGIGLSSCFECFAVGIDTSINLLRRNKNNFKLLGAAEYLPFKDNSFDCVISVTAFHNFNNIKKSINEIKRVGKRSFAFSILRKSKKYNRIRSLIDKSFAVKEIVQESKDTIFFCQKP